MKGHIRERSPGHWAIILDLNDSQTGARKRKWHSFKGTKREAQKECARLITEMDAGAYVEHDKKSLNEFLDTWERDWMAIKVSPKTAERYSELLKTHVRPALGDKRMQSIRSEDLNRLYAQLHEKIAPRTIKHIHGLLHRIFGHATKWRAIKHTSSRWSIPPRRRRRKRRFCRRPKSRKCLRRCAAANSTPSPCWRSAQECAGASC